MATGKDEKIENDVEPKLSPTSKWHNKCILGYDPEKKKKLKKKSTKKHPDEIIRFVEGTPGEASKLKSPKYNTEVRFLEHKYIQCNIIRANNDVEATLPEEIKSLLINVTVLLHELKQKNETKNREDLCNLISKIVTLLTEISRRPIKKSDDEFPKPFDEVADKLSAALDEHYGPDEEQYEKLVKEIKYLEEELDQKNSEVNYVKEQILEEQARLMSDSSSLEDCLRNSIIKNHSLKAEIKYNRAQFRKYTKIMAQKEQLKQKSLLELNSLKRKYAKLEHSQETKPVFLRLTQTESDVFHGGSVTKYIKSKVNKEKIKRRVVKGTDVKNKK